MAAVIAVATLVVLAGRLPGHAKMVGDLRPSDAQAHRVVDQHCEFRLCCFPREPCALDLPEHLGVETAGRSAVAGLAVPPAADADARAVPA